MHEETGFPIFQILSTNLCERLVIFGRRTKWSNHCGVCILLLLKYYLFMLQKLVLVTLIVISGTLRWL